MDEKDPFSQAPGKSPDTSLRKTLDSLLPEMVKRALFLGAGMLFMTEESVRKVLGEINLPREAVSYIMKQSEKSKTEFFSIFQRELNRFLTHIDVARLSREIMDGVSVEVNAKITLRTQSEEPAPPIRIDHLRATRQARKNKAKKEE
jgi:hypothetical protein